MVQDLLELQPPLTEWLQIAQRLQPLMVPEAANVQLCRRTAAERLDRFFVGYFILLSVLAVLALCRRIIIAPRGCY